MATITKRVRGDGKVRYQATIRIKKKGQVIYSESRSFAKRVLASDWAKGREVDLSRPGALAAVQHRGVTVGDLIKRYLVEIEEIRPVGRSKRSSLNFLQGEEIADKDAILLDVQDVMDHLRGRRLAGAGPATVQQDVAWLRVVFKYARRAWNIPVQPQVIQDAADTARESRITSRPRRRRRRPTFDELQRLDAYFASRKRSAYPMRLIMWFAIYSTRRQSEIFRIMRDDLDDRHGVGHLRDVKHPDGAAGNDREFVLPAPGWAVAGEIKKQVASDDGRLLPFDSKTVSSYFTRACKMLGIEDLRFHDLRHEGISRLAEDGYSIPQLQQVSLHDSWSSLQIYVNLPSRRVKRLDWEIS